MTSKGVAFITGASRGIGRAIALRLADDGFDIAINDLPHAQQALDELSKEITDKGRKTFFIIGDVSVDAEVDAMVTSVAENLGSLDVMVANAGICLGKSVVDTSVEEWDQMFAINGRGVFLCYKYAAKQMLKQGRGGRIIGAASTGAKQGNPFFGAYSASKFAVRGLTQSAAKELGLHGITVNAYAPGPIDTPMLRSVGSVFGSVEALFERERKLSATGQIGEPEDIASIVSYLASKEARYITGQSVTVDGARYCD